MMDIGHVACAWPRRVVCVRRRSTTGQIPKIVSVRVRKPMAVGADARAVADAGEVPVRPRPADHDVAQDFAIAVTEKRKAAPEHAVVYAGNAAHMRAPAGSAPGPLARQPHGDGIAHMVPGGLE